MPPVVFAAKRYIGPAYYDDSSLKWVNHLTTAPLRDPTAGIGTTEPLRHVLAGCWIYLGPALRELREEALRQADDLDGSLADWAELNSRSRH
jgi:hypothetical protein